MTGHWINVKSGDNGKEFLYWYRRAGMSTRFTRFGTLAKDQPVSVRLMVAPSF